MVIRRLRFKKMHMYMIHMIHPYDTCIIFVVFADRLMLPQAEAQGDTFPIYYFQIGRIRTA